MEVIKFLVNKFNLDLNNKSPFHLVDFGRDDLAKLFAELGFTQGAEVGVLFGRYSTILCQANPNLKLSCIDPWLSYKEYVDLTSQKDFNELYRRTKKNLAPYGCQIIRKKSLEAVVDFPDNSLDFVYIDGNHQFASEAGDIYEWSKKVRLGGIIAGHDYRKYRKSSFSHSYEVVNGYTQAYHIHPWFIIGQNIDSVRSWFWVKQE